MHTMLQPVKLRLSTTDPVHPRMWAGKGRVRLFHGFHMDDENLKRTFPADGDENNVKEIIQLQSGLGQFTPHITRILVRGQSGPARSGRIVINVKPQQPTSVNARRVKFKEAASSAMGSNLSSMKSVEDESRDVKNLLQLSKHGRWEDVFEMLNRSPYLVNAIPEDRRWGVIHQVVYWNNEGTLRRLLGYHICDLRLRAKESASEVGDTSRCTAYDIALKYGYTNISKLLERQSGHKVTIEENMEGLPTFQYESRDINLNGLGLLRVTLASYKQTFCPFTLTGTKSLNSVFSEIFEFVDRGNQWLTVKEKVCESLYTVCEPAVKVIKEAATKRQFYEKIIHVYTKESFQLYVYSNIALRRQDHRPYRPSAKDLGLGPYILMLHLLLLHWHPLTAENGTTYRRILVKKSDANRYQKGTQFVWLSFVSSSIDMSKAAPFPICRTYGKHKIYFIINNSTASKSQPRNIEAYGKRVEKERVYPAGTRFIVTDRTEHDDKTTTICLKLID